MSTSMLAQAGTEATEQIQAIYERVGTQPVWTFELVGILVVATAVVVVMMFLRQKKIAQNQVELGQMLKQLLEK